MDINLQTFANHHEEFVRSRLASAGTYRYGNASATATMIASMAAGIRKAAARIERWARGGNSDVTDYRLPPLRPAR